MSIDPRFYGDLMSRAIVSNGNICFDQQLDDGTLKEVYMRFTHDLFGRLIPHYRVVGIWHGYDDKHDRSLFRTNDIYQQSLIELSLKLKYLVPCNNGGNDASLGCFYGISEDMTEFQQSSEDFRGFCRDFGMDTSGKSIEARTANVLMVPREVIGSVMIETYHDEEDIKNYFTTSDVWYTKRMPEDVVHPRVLIPNKFISELYDAKIYQATTFMFIMRSTGEMSYEDTQKLFNPRCQEIMPCDAVWDLSQCFVCRMPDPGDGLLRLTYLETIDESVLNEILNGYGRCVLENEC